MRNTTGLLTVCTLGFIFSFAKIEAQAVASPKIGVSKLSTYYGTPANSSWSITGSSGTSPAINFLGTTDTASLVFKVNGYQAGRIDAGLGRIGYQNTFFGYQAGINITNGTYNTGIGFQALNSDTHGYGNVAVGDQALYSNTTGFYNVALGYQSLYSNTTGFYNTASGFLALSHNTTGFGNTATGLDALTSNGSGSNNTATGDGALGSNTIGLFNTATGVNALYSNISGSCNTVAGYNAGYNNTGSFNTFVGDSAGIHNTTGTYNTYIGYQSGNNPSLNTITNTTCLGYDAGNEAAIASNTIYLGDPSIANIYSEVTPSTYSDRRIKDNIQENVPGLAFINKLKAVTYNLNIHKQNKLTGRAEGKDWEGKYAIEKVIRTGFIAQQVDSAAKACKYDFSGVAKPQTSGGLYALGYSDFVVPLVKAVQELSSKNDNLHAKIDSLGSTVDSLRSAFKNIETCLSQICANSTSSNGGNGNTSENNVTANVQDVTLSAANSPVLYQNSPNPIKTGAKINYYLPEGTAGATVIFYDNYGNQIKQVQLNQTGNGSLNITSDNLSNGIYSYSLIVNGNIVDTKRMVLQK